MLAPAKGQVGAVPRHGLEPAAVRTRRATGASTLFDSPRWAAQQALRERIDSSPRMLAQRATLRPLQAGAGEVAPVLQLQMNSWKSAPTGEAAPLMRDELAQAMDIDPLALGWNGSPMKEIVASGCPLRPNYAIASLSQVVSDRPNNPKEVSVHASIGNLEARIRTASKDPAQLPQAPIQVPNQEPKSELELSVERALVPVLGPEDEAKSIPRTAKSRIGAPVPKEGSTRSEPRSGKAEKKEPRVTTLGPPERRKVEEALAEDSAPRELGETPIDAPQTELLADEDQLPTLKRERKAKQEKTAFVLSQPQDILTDWHKKMKERELKRESKGGEMYQAGHLVAFQFMGTQANVFQNVAPQGAQLNNVAFQNWEHDVLAKTILNVRAQRYPDADEAKIPDLFEYTVRVDYGGNYAVTPTQLVNAGVIPAHWQALTKARPVTVTLTQRIPTAWHARVMPLDGAAQAATRDIAAYGIVDQKGVLANASHFEASGPREIANVARRSAGLSSLGRREGDNASQRPQELLARQPSGFAHVRKAFSSDNAEAAEAMLLETPAAVNAYVLQAIINATAAYDGDKLRRSFAEHGTTPPVQPLVPWSDPVTGATHAPDAIDKLAKELSDKEKWQGSEDISKLRKSVKELGAEIKDLNITLKREAKLSAPLAQKPEGGDAERPEKTTVKDEKQEVSPQVKQPSTKEARDLKALEREALERRMAEMTDRLPGAVFVRYANDLSALTGTLSQIMETRARRERRQHESPAPTDPRKIDFLDPGPTRGQVLEGQFGFSAQDTQPS